MATTGGAGVLPGVNHHRPFRMLRRRRLPKTTVKCVYGLGCKPEKGQLRLKEYCEHANDMIRSDVGVGHDCPPRWFSPLECGGSPSNKSPLLLYLPGIDGTGLGLVLNHKQLGEIFEVWCLHIPVMDRTMFAELVEMVERTVRSENCQLRKGPIYLVGESIGACIALSVAARNPDIDLILVLANPATSFRKSALHPILPLLQIIPQQFNIVLHTILSLITGIPLKGVMTILQKGIATHQTVGDFATNLGELTSYLYVMANVLPRRTLMWKLKLINSASAYANSRLHAVKAQTLIISSEKDLLLPSSDEGERLCRILPNSESRMLKESGHALFLDDNVDLVTILKGSYFYRRGRCIDYASDYIPPTPSEFYKIYEPVRWMEEAISPVMLSTLEDGRIVRGLAGVPLEGPVVYVGYHMLLGCELNSLLSGFMIERDIILRGLAHRMLYRNSSHGTLQLDISTYDHFRTLGAVPVSAANFYRLLASNSHVLLYPGGSREAMHRKGEEYKLSWPEQSEFVRMAAHFGAKIVPFGAVGEDDIAQIILDYADLMKIGYLKDNIEKIIAQSPEASYSMKFKSDVGSEVGDHELYPPILLPKIPGRFYFIFGKPIQTKGRKQELRSSREKTKEMYAQVKLEVEKNILFLKKKRECDPYRSAISRIIYRANHGFDSQIPTFEL